MASPCKNCGRNTDSMPETLEWKGGVFCSTACLASYQKAQGVPPKDRADPVAAKNLTQILRELPTPLQVVVWLNAALAVVSLLTSLASVSRVPLQMNVQNGFDILLSVLIVIGILQASRLIRIIVLVFSWIAVISCAIAFVFGFVHLGWQTSMLLLPLGISAVTIWGLCERRSKAYFGY
jgi:CBS domain containing-hemolysin-like protein